MALFLLDSPAETELAGEFEIPVLPPFIRSHSLDRFKRQLRRYLRRGVRGRSFLIAGHRGAGKTSLVWRAVDECIAEALRDSVVGPRTASNGTGLPPQRPLMVSLHGPSLLQPEKREPAAPSSEGAAVVVNVRTQAPGAPEQPPPPLSDTSRALMQITIALYRALAAEAAAAFRVQARGEQATRGGDFAEVAGQLVLDLDRAPGPATLRAYWARLGKLDKGVFWPRDARWRGPAGGPDDQGVREILALATAAQAFQVCIGKVTDGEARSDAASDERTLKTAAGVNLANLSNKLIGLAAGVAATAAMSAAHGVDLQAVGVGLATGLVSAFTLGLTTERKTRREQTREYSFVPDRSLESLQRDLPLIIERLRKAGFAPVFVIDELDKIENREGVPPAKLIDDFIARFKQIITDECFYCFLTDREYFSEFALKLKDDPYSKESSFFTDVLFILYMPKEVIAFVRDIVSLSDASLSSDRYSRDILALVLLYRCKLNTLALMREISRQFDASGALLGEPDQFRANFAIRLQATVQLAINHVMAGEAMVSRMESEPIFGQIAVDALYYVPRAWEADGPSVALGDDALVLYMAGRISRARVTALDQAVAIIGAQIGEVDLDLIKQQARRLSDYLLDFKALDADLRRGWPQDDIETLDVIPVLDGVDRLLRLEKPGSHTAIFTFDAFGRDLRPKAAIDAGALVEVWHGFERVLRAARVAPVDLTAVGLLPNTLVWPRLRAAAAALQAGAAPPAELEAAALDLRSLRAVLTRRGQLVFAVLALAQRIAVDSAQPDARLPLGLAAMDRTLGGLAAALRQDPGAGAVDDWFEGAPAIGRPANTGRLVDRLARWTAFFEGRWAVATDREARKPLDLDELALAAWRRWRGRLARRGPGGADIPAPRARYDDAVLAAAGRGPGPFMRADPEAMSVADWSALALAALSAHPLADRPPFWAGVAALRILGFGGDLLAELAQAPPRGVPRDAHAAEFAHAGAATGVGAVLVFDTDPGLAAAPPNIGQPPKIAVPRERLNDYIDILEWLLDHRAVEAVTIGRS